MQNYNVSKVKITVRVTLSNQSICPVLGIPLHYIRIYTLCVLLCSVMYVLVRVSFRLLQQVASPSGVEYMSVNVSVMVCY